ncbi:MAG: hypothetical protein AAB839_02825, partial [Patescibacteria group bacterium]
SWSLDRYVWKRSKASVTAFLTSSSFERPWGMAWERRERPNSEKIMTITAQKAAVRRLMTIANVLKSRSVSK